MSSPRLNAEEEVFVVEPDDSEDSMEEGGALKRTQKTALADPRKLKHPRQISSASFLFQPRKVCDTAAPMSIDERIALFNFDGTSIVIDVERDEDTDEELNKKIVLNETTVALFAEEKITGYYFRISRRLSDVGKDIAQYADCDNLHYAAVQDVIDELKRRFPHVTCHGVFSLDDRKLRVAPGKVFEHATGSIEQSLVCNRYKLRGATEAHWSTFIPTNELSAPRLRELLRSMGLPADGSWSQCRDIFFEAYQSSPEASWGCPGFHVIEKIAQMRELLAKHPLAHFILVDHRIQECAALSEGFSSEKMTVYHMNLLVDELAKVTSNDGASREPLRGSLFSDVVADGGFEDLKDLVRDWNLGSESPQKTMSAGKQECDTSCSSSLSFGSK